jgi:hypothetical protein
MSREDMERVYSAPFGSRTGSKTFVKVPSRGLFGMANKLIQALPYMLSIELGLPLPQMPIEIQASSEGLVHIYNIGADVFHSAPFSALRVGASADPLTSRSFPLSVS